MWAVTTELSNLLKEGCACTNMELTGISNENTVHIRNIYIYITFYVLGMNIILIKAHFAIFSYKLEYRNILTTCLRGWHVHARHAHCV